MLPLLFLRIWFYKQHFFEYTYIQLAALKLTGENDGPDILKQPLHLEPVFFGFLYQYIFEFRQSSNMDMIEENLSNYFTIEEVIETQGAFTKY